MIQSLSCSITNYIIKSGSADPEYKEVYVYGFEVLLENLLQMLVLLIIGIATGQLPEYVFVTAAFAVMKPGMGGWHAKTHLQCLFFTTALVVMGVLLGGVLTQSLTAILLVATNLIIFWRAPVAHENNPKTEEEMRTGKRRIRIISTLFSVVVLTLLITGLQGVAAFLQTGSFIAALTILKNGKVGSNEKH